MQTTMFALLSFISLTAAQLTRTFDLYEPVVRTDATSYSMTAMDLDAVYAARANETTKAHDFAQVTDVQVDLFSVAPVSMENDAVLYATTFNMQNAVSMAFYFDQFELPKGCALYIVASSSDFLGPFTHETRWRGGDLQTQHINGNDVQVQLFCASPRLTGQAHIAKVATAYPILQSSDPCNINAICIEPQNSCNSHCGPTQQGCSIECTRFAGVSSNSQWAGADWSNQMRSTVAIMSQFGSRYCSGNFINNPKGQQLVLTANHCSVSGSDLLLSQFYADSCTSKDNSDGNTERSIGNLLPLASDSQVDNALLLVGERVPADWKVYLAGYDTTSSLPGAVVCLSHPSGANMKISHSNAEFRINGYYGGSANDHWMVVEWTEATTEGGSSGSALFDRDTKRIIGQLHGGSASCPAFNGQDYYGGLFASIAQPNMKQYLSAPFMEGAQL